MGEGRGREEEEGEIELEGIHVISALDNVV